MVQLGIFVAVTVGALLAFEVASRFLRADRGRIRRRLADEFDRPAAGPADRLYKDLDALDSQLTEEGEAPAERRGLARWQQRLDDALWQAGWSLKPRTFAWIVAASVVLPAAVGGWFGGWLGAAAAAGLGAVPVVALNAARKARQKRYLKQLAAAFELMARVLRAGQSVSEAFRAVADTFDDPLAGEFGNCLHQIEMGLRPEDAFRELGRRSPVIELRIFVIALAVQRQAGGNLSEVLDRLAALVHARVRFRQKVRSLTAEGRLQSLTLLALPPLTFGLMFFMNRQYAEVLLTHTWLLGAAVACMAVGVVWIRRIVNFEG